MVPGTVIIEQKTYLTYQPSTEDKGGKYFLTLILRDKKGHEYVFISKATYAQDESGKAYFDLSNAQTADFNYR